MPQHPAAMGLRWGDRYRRYDSLALTNMDPVDPVAPVDPVYNPPAATISTSPDYDLREDLFERDEDFFQEMPRKDFDFDSVYGAYKPSRQSDFSFSDSLRSIIEDGDDEIYFPSYDDVESCDEVESSDETESTDSGAHNTSDAELSVSPDTVERSEDDSDICAQPSRHVDYLSHDWTEEDVWSSWKFVTSNREAYSNSARLENASWRSWEKKRSNLRTVPPESVKWMKDHDLTWLYGPLTPGPSEYREPTSTGRIRRMSRANIMARQCKKPILKKRSISEIMLRQSISSSLLLKQAIEAKMGNVKKLFSLESSALSCSNPDLLSRKSASRLQRSEGWKKVQFYELVEQCIALANHGDEERDCGYGGESEEDLVVMRKSRRWSRIAATPPRTKCSRSKTIEKLPHAPLKHPEELEDLFEGEKSDGFCSSACDSPHLPGSIYSSHGSDEEDESDWQPSALLDAHRDSLQVAKKGPSKITTDEDAAAEPTRSDRPHLERRDAESDEEDASHRPTLSSMRGSNMSIKFDLPKSQLPRSKFSYNKTPRYQPRVDYFTADPDMSGDEEEEVEDEEEDEEDNIAMSLSLSSSQSNTESEEGEPSHLVLDNRQRSLVDRVMDEFWVLFSQQWDTTGSKSQQAREKKASMAALHLRRQNSKPNNFETTPDEGPSSPDSKELADYEFYLQRELPRLVRRSVEATIRDRQPKEAQLMGSLVSIVHDCQDKIYEAYFESPNRDVNIRDMGATAEDPFSSLRIPEEAHTEHRHSEILDAAFQPLPSQYVSGRRPPTRSSASSSRTPSSPSDQTFSDYSYASDVVASTITSPNLSRYETNTTPYSLQKVEGEAAKPVSDWELFEGLDKAVAWSQVN